MWLLVALLKRRLTSYPSVKELRARHQEIARADKFGQAMQNTLLRPSNFELKDLWRLYKMLPTEKKSKKSNELSPTVDEPTSLAPAVQIETPEGDPLNPTDDELNRLVKELDPRTLGLQALSELVDFHERCFK
jgi:hypothetical protein